MAQPTSGRRGFKKKTTYAGREEVDWKKPHIGSVELWRSAVMELESIYP